jgi:hypothetical protein
MTIDWTKVAPVALSIGVILAVAVLRQYSKTIAAIAAVMPINIPLAMWIIYSGTTEAERQTVFTDFTATMTINLIATFCFGIAAWYLAKMGYGLLPTIGGGYMVWGITMLVIYGIRTLWGG